MDRTTANEPVPPQGAGLIRRLTMTLALALTLAATANATTGTRVPQRAHTDAVISNLQAGLAGTPLEPGIRALEATARRHNVSPYLMAAIAGVESGYGRQHCTQNRYWVVGLGSCGRAWTPPSFRNWWQTWDYFARFLRERWLDRGVRSATSMGYTYCPPCGSRWGAAVEWHMSRNDWPRRVTYR